MASLSLNPHSFATLLQHPSSFSPASLTSALSKHYPAAWNLPLAHHHHRHPIHAAANDYSNSSTEAIFPGSQFSILHHQLNVSSHFVQALPTHAANAIAASVENPTTTALYYKEAEAKIAAPVEVEDVHIKVVQHSAEQMQEWIDTIRGMFCSMSLGEISISAYDTAWVALVPSLNDSGGPQFPKSLDWIIKNQLPDGSWGDRELFLSYDRICSTVACLVALKTWNIGLDNIQRGVDFIHGNLAKMEVEVEDYMPIGFEVVFPTMLDDARVLGLDLPYDSPMVRKIREEREKKLKSIPMEALHSHPTTLLHSLEGLHTMVDWKRLLKLQSKNGSFLFSPASTACALKYTGDKKCLDYLNSVLEKFDNAVPNVYPVDLFERMWVVDRLERLGISRYFKSEIKECLDYVYRYWTQNGIGWASESDVYDADDTAMGFRLLRLHGYDVSPEVFRRFKKGDEFFCFEGQTSQAVTGMYNLYRASQTMLPGESILHKMKLFTKSFLLNKQRKNEIKDKWIIAKALKGEVEYALNYPWNQSLPRIEARYYIDQYGVDDIWIGKSLYKMFYVNNEALLNLARADYNLCQSFHQKELAQVLRWNKQCQFDKLKFARQKPIECFFSIASTLFEPEYSLARIVWAMCGVLTTIIDDFFDVKGSLKELNDFLDAVKSWDPKLAKDFSQDMKILFMGLYNTMNNVNQEAFVAQGRDISSHLRHFFVRWITSNLTEAQWKISNYSPSLEEYMENAKTSIALEPIVQTTLFFLGERISEEDVMHEDYFTIMDMVNMVGRLNNDIQGFKRETSEGKWSSVTIYLKENPNATEEGAIQHFKLLIEHAMVSLVKEYLRDTILPRQCKQVHLNMAKIMNLFYRKTDGFTSITEMSQHVNNILYTTIS